MNTTILRKHLAKAERHVAEAERRVAHQRVVILELVGSGNPDIRTARDALETMQVLLTKYIAHRNRLVEELAKAGGSTNQSTAGQQRHP